MHERVLSYQGKSSPNQAREALVSVAVEVALLVAGGGIHKKVSDLLMDAYGCKITDCYKHPHYLREILSKLDSKTRSKITNAIQQELDEYSYIKTVSSFLSALQDEKSAGL